MRLSEPSSPKPTPTFLLAISSDRGLLNSVFPLVSPSAAAPKTPSSSSSSPCFHCHPPLSLLWLQVKIQGQNKEMLAAACQMFLGKTEAEIAHIALETLEGHQRAIMAHMTVEVGLGDRRRPGLGCQDERYQRTMTDQLTCDR